MKTSGPSETISVIAPLPDDAAFLRRWCTLERKLLSAGGQEIVWCGHERHLKELVTRGETFALPVRVQRGKANHCHKNASNLWANNPAKTQVVTGYGLSKDGLWRPHSWALRNGCLIETTVKCIRYFGVILSEQEALNFWFLTRFSATPSDRDFDREFSAYPSVIPILKRYSTS